MVSLPLTRAVALICSSSHAVNVRVLGSRRGLATRWAGLALWVDEVVGDRAVVDRAGGDDVLAGVPTMAAIAPHSVHAGPVGAVGSMGAWAGGRDDCGQGTHPTWVFG